MSCAGRAPRGLTWRPTRWGTDAEQAKVDAVRDAHRLMSFDLKNMERQVTILKFRVAMLATQLTPEEP